MTFLYNPNARTKKRFDYIVSYLCYHKKQGLGKILATCMILKKGLKSEVQKKIL